VAKAKEKVGIAAEADVALAVYPPPKPLVEQIREALRVSVAQNVAAALPWTQAFASAGSWFEAIAVEGPVLAPSVWIEIH
jgi:hypothetical protein